MYYIILYYNIILYYIIVILHYLILYYIILYYIYTTNLILHSDCVWFHVLVSSLMYMVTLLELICSPLRKDLNALDIDLF